MQAITVGLVGWRIISITGFAVRPSGKKFEFQL